MASVVGVPLYANATIETRRRISFACICVEIDASKPLIEDFILDVPNTNNPDLFFFFFAR